MNRKCSPRVCSSEYPELGSEYPELSSEYPDLSSEYPDLSSERPALNSEYPPTAPACLAGSNGSNTLWAKGPARPPPRQTPVYD